MTSLDLPPAAQAVVAGPPHLWWARRGETGSLAGMAQPAADYDFSRLADLGLDTVVSLVGPARYDAAPLAQRVFSLHDLVGGLLPPDPVGEEQEVRAAVACVRELLAGGANVVVHCHGGVGRTGTVIASTLISLGHDPETVLHWLDQVQRTRGARHGWPESPWQRQIVTGFAAR
jgi:hypothetical protein